MEPDATLAGEVTGISHHASSAPFESLRAPSRPSIHWLTSGDPVARLLAQTWAVKFARIVVYLVGISALLALLLVDGIDPRSTSAMFVQCLVWLSWAQILLAFTCSGPQARTADLTLLQTLFCLRGVTEKARPTAIFAGYFQLLLWPLLWLGGALAIAHAGLSSSIHQFTLRAIQVPFALAYFVLLGAVLARLCQLAQAQGGRHGRLLFLGGIALPYMVSLFWPHFPNVPSLFGWLLDTELLRAGA